MPVITKNQSLYNPIWKKSPDQILKGLSMASEMGGFINPMPIAKIPIAVERMLANPAQLGQMTERFGANYPKILQNQVVDKLGNKMVYAHKMPPQELFNVFDETRRNLGGYPEAISKYLGYVKQAEKPLKQVPYAIEKLSEIPAKIPEAGTWTSRLAEQYPQIFTVGGAVMGKQLADMWREFYSDMPFGQFMTKLKAKTNTQKVEK